MNVIPKVCGLNIILYTINNMDYEDNPELREEGKRAANQMISVIRASRGDSFATMHYEIAYLSLAKFSHADQTKDGHDMALLNYGKLRDFHESRGNARKVKDLNARIKKIKSERDGQRDINLDRIDIEEEVKQSRELYARHVKQYGEESSKTFQSASILIRNLWGSGLHGLENERLADKLFSISRRVHGPEHPETKEFQQFSERCKSREVGIKLANVIREWQVLGFEEDEEKYVIKGPIMHPRVENEELTIRVPINELIMLQGTPVTCHGLKNAAHLNGKIGDVKSPYEEKVGRYVVRFEDKTIKPALVKPENLRIILDLSGENAS